MRNQRNLVNRLVRKSFGILYSGDWNPGRWLVYGGSADYRGKELNCIGRLKLWSLGFYAKGAGRFLDKDGSKLEVLAKHLSKAKKYAKLFKEKIGEDVSIKILPNDAYKIPSK